MIVVDWLHGLQLHQHIEPGNFGRQIADLGKQLAVDFFQFAGFHAADLLDESEWEGKCRGAAADEKGLGNDQRQGHFQGEARAQQPLRFNLNIGIQGIQVGTHNV